MSPASVRYSPRRARRSRLRAQMATDASNGSILRSASHRRRQRASERARRSSTKRSRGSRIYSGSSLASSSLQGIAFVISSPFLRCLQTATNFSKAMGLESIGIANGLSEVINDSCSIHEQPIVPSPTIEKEGVASLNDAGIVCPVPNYRESFGEAFRRQLKIVHHWNV